MKLNERMLMALAADSRPPDKAGYLTKKGEVNKGFQKRYFVLRGNLLFYFEKQQDRVPIGVVVLENCHVELCSNEGSAFAFQIVFSGSGARRYVLAANDNDDMLNWMKRMTHAGHAYIKSSVEYLEKRLDKLKKAESEMVHPDVAKSNNYCQSDEEIDTKPKPESFIRSKYKTLPAKALEKMRKPSDKESRWSVVSSRDTTHLLETRPKFKEWVDFSERTDILSDNPDDANRRFSINDFTPPSFEELKKQEKILEKLIIDVNDTPNNVKISETTLSNSLANKLRRAKSEKHRRALPNSLSRNIGTGSIHAPKNRIVSRERNDTMDDSKFQHLHRFWGASIWVKVKEFEMQQDKALGNNVK